VTDRPTDLVSLWPVEVGAADSGSLTRVIEVPVELAAAESWVSDTAAPPPTEQLLDDAYRRFIAVVDACDAAHSEVDAVFTALRDLQATGMDQSATSALERLNGAWLRLDSKILHLAGIAPRCLDAVCSVTSDLYQVLRQLLARRARFEGETPPQFKVEMETLAARLARHDRYANAQGSGQ
jgi:hypothetical protein